MSIRETIIKWLIPSEWIKWLKGRKRLLGLISLALWAVIYAVPQVYPDLAYLAPIALKVQEFLVGLGLQLNQELLVGGAAVTVIGLVDWVVKHLISDTLIALFKAVEATPRKIQEAAND